MHVQVSRVIQSSPHKVWAILTDWKTHEHLVPFTKITLGKTRDGILHLDFKAVTALILSDPMVVESYNAPPNNNDSSEPFVAKLELKKVGCIVRGTAGFSAQNIVDVDAEGTCLVRWWEDIYFINPTLTKIFEPILKPVVKKVFSDSLKKLETIVLCPATK